MSTTFLDPFNAKAMKFRDVASSFVPSPNFSQLAGNWNALLVGPRGSGKTTLMKMLTVEALRNWSGPEADEYRRSVGFSGIYVPSDIAWGEMVRSLTVSLDEDTTSLISGAAFLTNVFQSTIAAMKGRFSRSASNESASSFKLAACDPGKLETAVKEIAVLWRLEINSVSLEGLASALANRQVHIRQQANLMTTSKRRLEIDELAVRMPYIGLPLVETLSNALKLFNDAINEPEGIWALLLDEFEVAPDHLQRDVLTSLRASASIVLFKVALAPCGPHTLLDISYTSRPTSKNDYEQVDLWYANRDSADEFCRRIFESRKTKWNNVPSSATPEDVFGVTGYAIVDEDGQSSKISSYGKGILWEREFSSLAEKDDSFKEYLKNKNIDPKALDPSPQAPNGNTIRKIAPIVAFRNAYKGRSAGKRKGRKPYNSAYSGWAAICAISEGNPRWLIGIINAITANLASGTTKLPISVAAQQGQLTGLSQTFAGILSAAATGQLRGMGETAPVYETLAQIGNHFHIRLVLDDFVEDPPMSFTVDKDIEKSVENALRLAINHGALVCYETPDSLGGFTSLTGKRFRLAYLLAPELKLPLRKSKPVALSTALERASSSESVVQQPIEAINLPIQKAFSWD